MKDKNKKEKIEYISLFEAAKISGYAQDYLSLLCRQGKLKGEKIGRNWVTTYQWLDEYQRNLISDMALKKNSIAPKKDFKEIESVERITEKKNKFLKRIKIFYKRAELVLAASLCFIILFSGFTYAKNPQFFSDFAAQGYQTKNQIAYRMFGMKNNNIYPLKVGEKFGKTIVNVPMKIGNEIEKEFKKSDLVLNSSLRKTNLAIQNGVNNFSKGVLVFFGTADREKEFGRVAGVNTEKNLEIQELSSRISESSTLGNLIKSLANGFNNFSQKIVWSFGDFKKNVRLAMSDAMDVFKRGIILCRTTLTIQSELENDKKFDEKTSDKFTEQNQISENQETIQKSSEELSEGANNQMREVLIVAPSPESEEAKEKLKEKIELSFSDEVKVKPEDKNSGIITPVFREGEENDYLYLLIPMKEER